MLDYSIYLKYPDLVIKVIEYFRLTPGININCKCVEYFCEKTAKKIENRTDFIYDPQYVIKVCDELVAHNRMSCISHGDFQGFDSNYVIVIKDYDKWKENIDLNTLIFNSLVYGFYYIYNFYKNSVLPLVYRGLDESEQIGTCFIISNYIVTAKHCIEGAKNIAIKNFNKDELSKSKVYFSNNDNLDIAVIELNTENRSIGYISNGKVLDDIMVLGYPKIPGYTEFLAAEKGTISSIGKRLTPSEGSIAAIGKSIFTKTDMILVTARIAGGNSGGPVINNEGGIVGIACQTPYFEGNYDNLGYGIVVPSYEISNIIFGNKIEFEKTNDLFINYMYD